MATRKDYKALDTHLKLAYKLVRGDAERLGADLVLHAVIQHLAEDNPLFDRDKFVRAIKGE